MKQSPEKAWIDASPRTPTKNPHKVHNHESKSILCSWISKKPFQTALSFSFACRRSFLFVSPAPWGGRVRNAPGPGAVRDLVGTSASALGSKKCEEKEILKKQLVVSCFLKMSLWRQTVDSLVLESLSHCRFGGRRRSSRSSRPRHAAASQTKPAFKTEIFSELEITDFKNKMTTESQIRWRTWRRSM